MEPGEGFRGGAEDAYSKLMNPDVPGVASKEEYAALKAEQEPVGDLPPLFEAGDLAPINEFDENSPENLAEIAKETEKGAAILQAKLEAEYAADEAKKKKSE